MRMTGKTVLIIGAGQSPGEGVGNGRACALVYAREGARVLAADRNLDSAQETAELIKAAGGEAMAVATEATNEASLRDAVTMVVREWRQLDVLHYNVGVSLSGGDKSPLEITEADFDNVNAINLRGYVMACKHGLPVMREQGSGAIIGISSVAAMTTNYQTVAYKTSKAGMIAYTEQIAQHNAPYGIRANVILPGLMNTPMAVDTRAREWQLPREQVVAERDARVPLRNKMGSAWDVANACLFLASDEAGFITGVALPVDGGALLRTGY
ncbi:MAG: SDR family NAD(P)-dependent oxidoreductase [Burkholderiaceae bacterium]